MTLLGSGHNLLGVPWRFHWHLGLGFSTLHDSCPTHFPECQQPFWKPWEPLNITTWVAWFHHEMHTGIYMPRHANCSPFKIAGCGTHSTSTIQAWLESQSSEFVWTKVYKQHSIYRRWPNMKNRDHFVSLLTCLKLLYWSVWLLAHFRSVLSTHLSFYFEYFCKMKWHYLA